MADAPPEVRERLLKAWEGEIVAGGVYELIARRMPDREGEILRRMASAEGEHRRRLDTLIKRYFRLIDCVLDLPVLRFLLAVEFTHLVHGRRQ